MKPEIDQQLSILIRDLDNAINQAVDNPLQFVESPILNHLRTTCSALEDLNDRECQLLHQVGSLGLTSQREALLWQVRTRAGRLQKLLDSAANFYSHCFSTAQSEGLAYGVQGEWSTSVSPRHLAVDC